jgi:2-methylisocitrate lyase-like PEP mutase family enzyme
MSPHAVFKALHHQDQPLLLANAWDAGSAKLFEQAGAPAIGTSSAGMAWSLGYADGGALPVAELTAAVLRLLRVVQVPLTVDIEDGYSSEPAAVAQLAHSLVQAGVVGINLEDGSGPPERLVAKIKHIRQTLAGAPLFINARCDVVVRGLAPQAEAVGHIVQRLRSYEAAGADGGFVPGLCALADVQAVVAQQPMPLNLMLVPSLPDVAALQAAGVRRISVGSSPFYVAYAAATAGVQSALAGDLALLRKGGLDYRATNALFSA